MIKELLSRKITPAILIENRKAIGQFIFVSLFIAIAYWFFKHQSNELSSVEALLRSCKTNYLLAGFGVTLLYITLQGSMYKLAFKSVGEITPLYSTVILFLKRNFIGVFIPAGGVSSLAFFASEIETLGIQKSKIHLASGIYGFLGIISVGIIALPVILYALFEGLLGNSEWIGLILLILLVIILFSIIRSIRKKGRIYQLISKYFPNTEFILSEISSSHISKRYFIATLFISLLIDLSGFVHLIIALHALGFNPTIIMVLIGYISAVVSLIVSPFMRGMGAVEVSIAYILTHFGLSGIEAISTAFLYRFFEFWLPLGIGMCSFMLKISKLIMRIVPSMLLLILGLVNILSGITPAINERLVMVKEFLPTDIIFASNYLVIIFGVIMILTATFLIKGLRSAWWIAFTMSMLSIVAHITKAIDYEEALVALAVVIILLASRKEYYVKTDPKLANITIITSFYFIAAVAIYGTIGFYFLKRSHFNVDFNVFESIKYTLMCFFSINPSELIPRDTFAYEFLTSIQISGGLSILLLCYTLFRPYIIQIEEKDSSFERAKELVKQYGHSALDYFKTYSDKFIYAPNDLDGFISYRISGNFAVVLEDPVANHSKTMNELLKRFERFCNENGLKTVYYRVPSESLGHYRSLGKYKLLLGQEAIVDLNKFTLIGKEMKTIRNAINKVEEKGFRIKINTPPIKGNILQQLKSVSDEWLQDNNRGEICFSQGMFNTEELREQTILTVESYDGRIIAFMNIIPDYAIKEGTFDLIRKTNDAPNGVMDYLHVQLFNYLKQNGYRYVNLGLAPLSGLEQEKKIAEKSLRFAYNSLRVFASYRGLRDYKEKFASQWQNRYLIYDEDYDLLQMPQVLNRVIKP